MKNYIKKRVAVLLSGSGSHLQALMSDIAAKSTRSHATIVLVVSNNAKALGLSDAHRAGLPTKVVDHTAFPDRATFEYALTTALKAYDVELVCLAGFMRILTPKFVQVWKGRLINIHPSLLPLFPGTKTHQQALESGVTVHGTTVHFVDEGLDTGAIILQGSIPIYPTDTVSTLAARITTIEHSLYPRALEAIASGQVYLDASGKAIWKYPLSYLGAQ